MQNCLRYNLDGLLYVITLGVNRHLVGVVCSNCDFLRGSYLMRDNHSTHYSGGSNNWELQFELVFPIIILLNSKWVTSLVDHCRHKLLVANIDCRTRQRVNKREIEQSRSFQLCMDSAHFNFFHFNLQCN